MSFKKKLSTVVIGSIVSTGAVALVATAPADAATITDKLYVAPGAGNTSSLIDFVTAQNQKCPAGTGSVQVILTGQTLTEDSPAVVTGNSDYTQVQGPSNNLRVQAGSTLAAVFADVGISTINGTYTANLQCLDSNLQESDRFTVAMAFTSTGVGTASYSAANPNSATSTVVAGPTSSTAGDNVTFTATVTAEAPLPANSASGSVQFKDGGVDLGAPVPVSGGTASFSTSSLSAGSHAITAQYIPTGAYVGSTSTNTINHTVSSQTTTTTLTGPAASTEQGQNASFTATVSPAKAGTVQFKEGATLLGSSPVDTGTGEAVFSTTGLAPGTHVINATFVPANPAQVQGSTSGDVTHIVNALPTVVTETLTVEVPAGALTLVIDSDLDGDGLGVVDLGTAVIAADGTKLTASGEIDPVRVTDTRAGDPGWTLSGVVTNFGNGTDEVNGFNLGWTPEIVSLSANQQGAFLLGSAVGADFVGTPTGSATNGALGLKTSRTLGTAPDNSGNGTAVLGAGLDLNIPTDVSAGTYTATLTLTVVG